jgi:hypothetical protein
VGEFYVSSLLLFNHYSTTPLLVVVGVTSAGAQSAIPDHFS